MGRVHGQTCEICGTEIEPGRAWKRYCASCKETRKRERLACASKKLNDRAKARTASRHDELFSKMCRVFGCTSFNTRMLSDLMGKSTPEGLGPVLSKMEREGRIERVAKCKYRIKGKLDAY